MVEVCVEMVFAQKDWLEAFEKKWALLEGVLEWSVHRRKKCLRWSQRRATTLRRPCRPVCDMCSTR